MTLKTVYELTISTLTPLHIGDGEKLERDFDYATHDKRTWVIDQDVFGEQMLSEGGDRFDRMLQAVPPGQLLQPEDFDPDSPLFRYVMRGTPNSSASGSAVQAQIKDVYDRAYLPGSSLKGALRTIIFRHAYDESQQQLNPAALNRSRSWAAQKLERQLLGRDPNHDLLRALHVSDSSAVDPGQSLVLLNAQVFGQHKGGSPIALESLKGDTTFHATLTIDDFLFTNRQAQRQLGMGDRRQWLTSLPELANKQARHRIRQEVTFYQPRSRSRAARFYLQLASLIDRIPPNSFLLQVGWGGGWDSKTLGYLVPAAEKAALIKNYRLSRGQHQPGDLFPKSRRAIAGGGRTDDAEPLLPFGWLLVEMNKRE